jgi:rhodanese-related sulfurtransferase
MHARGAKERGSSSGSLRNVPTRIEFAEFSRLRDEGAQIVEVLPKEDYDWAHIPGAINLPLKELDASTAAAKLDRERQLVVYCHDYL